MIVTVLPELVDVVVEVDVLVDVPDDSAELSGPPHADRADSVNTHPIIMVVVFVADQGWWEFMLVVLLEGWRFSFDLQMD